MLSVQPWRRACTLAALACTVIGAMAQADGAVPSAVLFVSTAAIVR